MTKTFISTYKIRVRNWREPDDFFPLGNINGESLIDIFKDFLAKLERTPISIEESEYTQTLRLGKTLKIKSKKGIIYGFLESGVSGEFADIVDIKENKDEFSMNDKHARMTPLFFYLKIYSGRNEGFLVLQRKSSYGIKTLLLKAFKRYLNQKGATRLYVEINNVLSPAVLKEMLDKGKVSQLTLIKKKFPNEIDELVDKGTDWTKVEGIIENKTIIKNRLGLPVKGFLKKSYFSSNGEFEMDGLQDRFHDIHFNILHNGSNKTYYLKKQNKTLPDLDVTNRIILENYAPTLKSILEVVQEEVKEMEERIITN